MKGFIRGEIRCSLGKDRSLGEKCDIAEMIVNSVGVAVQRRCEGVAAKREAVLRAILGNLYGSFGGKDARPGGRAGSDERSRRPVIRGRNAGH